MLSWLEKLKGVFTNKQKAKDRILKYSFGKLKSENKKRDLLAEKIFSRLNSHFLMLKSHGKELALLKSEMTNYKNLAEEISQIKSLYSQEQSIKRLSEPTNRLNVPNQPAEQPLKLASLSTQEKRILMVLFDNIGAALSYEDIAKLLHKAPNTVKAQINQIKGRTNLLKDTVDSEGKKRYCLKEKIKLEKFVT